MVQVMAWYHRQQAITWTHADQDLWCHIVSPDHNELTCQYQITTNDPHFLLCKLIIIDNIEPSQT